MVVMVTFRIIRKWVEIAGKTKYLYYRTEENSDYSDDDSTFLKLQL